MGGNLYGRPEINLPYIKKVLGHIEGNILRLEMRTYLATRPTGNKGLYDHEWPECDTMACFAGWGFLLSLAPEQRQMVTKDATIVSSPQIHNAAQRLFGFTIGEAEEVFNGDAVNVPHSEQLVALKSVLNKILEQRGIEERV